MMMVVMVVVMMTIGHECIWGTVWGISKWGGKDMKR
jgi:hypothetical protein